MTTHAHLPRNDHSPLSPTFADSAIDTDTDTDNDVDVNAQQLPQIPFSVEVQKAPELQAVATATIERQEVAERLAELAQRVSSLSEEEEEGTAVSEDVVRCLEILERTLPPPDESGHATKEGYGDDEDEDEDEPDPRAAFVQEIAKHRRRPRSYPSTTTTTRSFHRSCGAPSPSTIQEVPARAQATDPQPSPQPQPQLQLQHILDQITALNHDLTARRNESSHVYELFTRRCQGLERSVAVLQEEVRELNADIHQSSIERESLRGTVYGLETWVDGWRREDFRGRWSKQKPRGRRMLQLKLELEDRGCEALVEGIRAWMRGWKDIDEGVRVREREREEHREARHNAAARGDGK